MAANTEARLTVGAAPYVPPDGLIDGVATLIVYVAAATGLAR